MPLYGNHIDECPGEEAGGVQHMHSNHLAKTRTLHRGGSGLDFPDEDVVGGGGDVGAGGVDGYGGPGYNTTSGDGDLANYVYGEGGADALADMVQGVDGGMNGDGADPLLDTALGLEATEEEEDDGCAYASDPESATSMVDSIDGAVMSAASA
jgi:hypothetical protein